MSDPIILPPGRYRTTKDLPRFRKAESRSKYAQNAWTRDLPKGTLLTVRACRPDDLEVYVTGKTSGYSGMTSQKNPWAQTLIAVSEPLLPSDDIHDQLYHDAIVHDKKDAHLYGEKLLRGILNELMNSGVTLTDVLEARRAAAAKAIAIEAAEDSEDFE